MSASDTNTGWIAHRAPGQFGQPFTVYTTFSGVASTPYVWGDDNEGSVYVYAVFGSQLKYAKVQPGSLSWHVANNCAVAGSPTFNSIRGTNGHLLHFVGRFADSSFGCSDIGEGLTSSPFAMEAPADQLIFFRGNSGGLWAKDVVPNSPEFGNHWSLGISLP